MTFASNTNGLVTRENLGSVFKRDEGQKKYTINLSDDFQIAGDKLAINGDNFSKALDRLEFANNTLKAYLKDGTFKEVNLSELAPTLDLHVTSHEWSGNTLKLKSNGDEPDVEIDMTQFKGVVAQTTDTVEVQGQGTTEAPFKANVKVDSDPSNMLTASAAGLKVAKPTVVVTDAFGTELYKAYEA